MRFRIVLFVFAGSMISIQGVAAQNITTGNKAHNPVLFADVPDIL